MYSLEYVGIVMLYLCALKKELAMDNVQGIKICFSALPIS